MTTDAREQAVARLDGMEDVLVSGVHLNTEACLLTIHDLPDVAGHCGRIFRAVAEGGILVDMIVQNITGPTLAELSFTVPQASAAKAVELVQAMLRTLAPGGRVAVRDTITVLYVLGVGMRTHTGVARTMFGALARQNINIELINTSEVCLSVVIDSRHSAIAENALKQAFRLL